MDKIKVYLDTSTINALFAYETPWRIEATELFFDKVVLGKYEAFVSELVLAEIGQTRNIVKRQQLLSIIEEYQLKKLAITEETIKLAHKYLTEQTIPREYEADAIHIATATINRVDILLSWNFKHIVKYETKLLVNEVNGKMGYSNISILSPEEV